MESPINYNIKGGNSKQGSKQSKRILIYESNPLTSFLIKRLLRNLGYKNFNFFKRNEILDKHKFIDFIAHYNVVIINPSYCNLSKLEFCKPNNLMTKIIALSVYSEREVEEFFPDDYCYFDRVIQFDMLKGLGHVEHELDHAIGG